jgi:hypothetical protein
MNITTRALAAALIALPALLAQPRRIVLQGTIDQPGSYILPNDLTVAPGRGPGILVTASGVDLDLAGNNITGPGGIQGTGVMVRGAAGVTIRNGKFSQLAFGVVVDNSANVSVIGNHFRGEGLAPAAPPPETAVMIVQSRGVVVDSNLIYRAGLGIFVRGGRSGGNRISNNTIASGPGVAALGICYNPAPGDPDGPRGDLIQGNVITGYGISIQMSPTSVANIIKGNSLFFVNMAVDSPAANMDMDNSKVKLP